MNTTHFLNLAMGNLFKTSTNPAIPSTYYIGLSKTAPNINGTNVTEPSGNGYARKSLSGVLGAPSNGVITNTKAIDFAESTGNWGTITHFVVFDASTGGNLLIYGAISPSRTVEDGTIMTVPTGALKLTLQNSNS